MKKGILMIVLTAIISGFSIYINKFGVSMGNPFIFTFLKNIIVFLFIFGIIIFVKDFDKFKFLKKKDWIKLVLIGLVGGSIPFLLFFKGLSITTSAKAAFIHKTMFLYVAFLAYSFLKERFNWKFLVASLSLIIGNFLFLKLTFQPFNQGDFLIFIATIFWASENILSKHTLKNVSSNIVGFGRMFFGSIFIMIFLVATGNISDLLILNKIQLLWAVVPSIFLALFVLFWYSGLKDVSVTLATSILIIASPITTLLNLINAGIIINISQAFGIVLIVSGIVMAFYSIKETKLSEPNLFVA